MNLKVSIMVSVLLILKKVHMYSVDLGMDVANNQGNVLGFAQAGGIQPTAQGMWSHSRAWISLSTERVLAYAVAKTKLLVLFLRQHSAELQLLINEQTAAISQQGAWAAIGLIPDYAQSDATATQFHEALYLVASIPVIIEAASHAREHFFEEVEAENVEMTVFSGAPAAPLFELLHNILQRLQYQKGLLKRLGAMYSIYKDLFATNMQSHDHYRYPREAYYNLWFFVFFFVHVW